MVKRAAAVGRDAYRHFTRIATRWSDNDAYGHVNNTIFYQWFDSAVNQWLIGQGLLEIAAGDPIGVVAETGCRFFAALAFPGDVDIGIAVEALGSSSVTYRIGIFAAGSEQAAAQGHFTHVCVNRASRRPVSLPAAWRAALAELS